MSLREFEYYIYISLRQTSENGNSEICIKLSYSYLGLWCRQCSDETQMMCTVVNMVSTKTIIVPRREKTCLRRFRQSETQISLLSYTD